MLLFIFATYFIMLSAGCDVSSCEELKWPERYKVQATFFSVTSGLVEDFVVWKTNDSSRVDYNHGAVKTIIQWTKNLSKCFFYKIHPETTKYKYNKVTCYERQVYPSSYMLDTVLPILSEDFKPIGHESILGVDTVRFEAMVEDHLFQTQTKLTIWAVQRTVDGDERVWSPVRYEQKLYNNLMGALKEHVVYEYSELSFTFEDDVFDATQFGCRKFSEVDGNSDDFTEDLLFINPEDPQHVDHIFKSYENKFGRQYFYEEHALRRSLLQKSMRLVDSVNRKNLGYNLNINEFADRTPEEMTSHTGLVERPEGKSKSLPFPYTNATLKDAAANLPVEYDMRLLGLVTPVKNQGTCGSCWTFAATAVVEGALARVNESTLLSLANQAIIDCAWDSASGCDGGSVYDAFSWIKENGLPTEQEYGSFANMEGYCNIRNMTKLYSIREHRSVRPSSVDAMKVALVNYGPLTVSVQITDAFQLYSSGVFYDQSCRHQYFRKHEVALVGYALSEGELFWILKNSWGPFWGLSGYMHMSARDNTCGVENEPTYVVI